MKTKDISRELNIAKANTVIDEVKLYGQEYLAVFLAMIIHRVAMKYIASYIGVWVASLIRIRKNRNQMKINIGELQNHFFQSYLTIKE